MKNLNVVCAVIRNNKGEYLLAQRSDSMPHSGFWEFAGGKVEQDESNREALKREIREELGCDIKIELCLERFSYTYPDVHVSINVYLCKLQEGSYPLALEHSEIRWVELEEIYNMDLLESNKQIVERLINVISV